MRDLSGRTIVFLVTEDWYFLSHRLPLARAAKAAGAHVVVATRLNQDRARLEAEGFTIAPIPFDRSGLNPIRDVKTWAAIHRVYRRYKPDLVHHVAMKPTLYGTLAALLCGVPHVVNAMAGMGFLFISQGAKARLLRGLITGLMGWLNRRARVRVIVQNDDDRALFRDAMGVRDDRINTIRGSGVDVTALTPQPEPPVDADHPPVALCLSRMLWDKGIGELVEAARLLKARGVPLTIRLVGPLDANPAAIAQSAWSRPQAKPAISRANTRAAISRCCPATGKACRNLCWKPPPAGGRWWQATFPAVGKFAARWRPACLSPPGRWSRWPMRSPNWRTIRTCARNSPPTPGARRKQTFPPPASSMKPWNFTPIC